MTQVTAAQKAEMEIFSLRGEDPERTRHLINTQMPVPHFVVRLLRLPYSYARSYAFLLAGKQTSLLLRLVQDFFCWPLPNERRLWRWILQIPLMVLAPIYNIIGILLHKLILLPNLLEYALHRAKIYLTTKAQSATRGINSYGSRLEAILWQTLAQLMQFLELTLRQIFSPLRAAKAAYVWGSEDQNHLDSVTQSAKAFGYIAAVFSLVISLVIYVALASLLLPTISSWLASNFPGIASIFQTVIGAVGDWLGFSAGAITADAVGLAATTFAARLSMTGLDAAIAVTENAFGLSVKSAAASLPTTPENRVHEGISPEDKAKEPSRELACQLNFPQQDCLRKSVSIKVKCSNFDTKDERITVDFNNTEGINPFSVPRESNAHNLTSLYDLLHAALARNHFTSNDLMQLAQNTDLMWHCATQADTLRNFLRTWLNKNTNTHQSNPSLMLKEAINCVYNALTVNAPSKNEITATLENKLLAAVNAINGSTDGTKELPEVAAILPLAEQLSKTGLGNIIDLVATQSRVLKQTDVDQRNDDYIVARLEAQSFASDAANAKNTGSSTPKKATAADPSVEASRVGETIVGTPTPPSEQKNLQPKL